MKSIKQFLMYLLIFMTATKTFSQQAYPNLNVMPIPKKIEFTSEKFRLNGSFKIAIEGTPHERLYSGATRILRRLAGRTGLFLPQDFVKPEIKFESPGLLIQCRRPGKVQLGEDESYFLEIISTRIALKAETDLGALHGLETILQLLSVDEAGYFFPGVKIEDAPRFPWRGLLIDACRHFMPVDVIKRNLDGMAAVKLNVLHWHLSEDQGFRVESKKYPKLHQMGSDGFYYTQEQIKDLIAYADARGIRVVPEFDIPGHATSWLVAYPEYASAPGPYTIERTWGVKDPTFDPTNGKTYKFLENFFKEMFKLFPDEYFHIGGDENNGKQWNANPRIQTFMKKKNIPDNHALQAHFNNRILKILTRHKKKMVGWDEILHKDMPTNIVIQSWRGREAMITAAQQGYQSILSNGYYIDLIQPTDFHYLNDPLPPDTPLSKAEQKKILGGEATMWSEFVSAETIDSRIWPRTAAIAERFWSPGHVNDVEDMYRRLDVISLQLEEHGLTHEKNYLRMLRRLTRGDDISALKNLVDVIEPVKGYRRNRLRPHTSYSPLTRVVDAARPDAKIARQFRRSVNRFLSSNAADKALSQEIITWLNLWKENHSALLSNVKQSPILREIESLSQDLSSIAAIGLECMKRIEGNQKAEKTWIEEQLHYFEKAKVPRGETELMIIPAIEKLVQAVTKVEL